MYSSPIGEATLLAFVPLSILLFLQLPLAKATALTLFGAALFLPERIEFDPPLIPPLNKESISTLVAFVAVSIQSKTVRRRALFIEVATGILLLGAFGTVFSNLGELRVAPSLVKPGLAVGDVISMTWSLALGIVVPFAIGRRVFSTTESATVLLRIIVAFGVIYACLMLFEIRMSPQLNKWVYGFHQHDFRQARRNDGYRPVVFMSHGLTTTLFCLTSIFGAITLKRLKQKIFEVPAGLWAIFLTLTLLLSNSMGALIYLAIALPLLWLGNGKLIGIVTRSLAWAILIVPCLRMMGYVPIHDIIDYFVSIDPERAQSLAFRFLNEEGLIQRWSLQPIFGFGGYGRSDVRNELGESISITDSQWILALCTRGFVGFVGEFLFYASPVLAAKRLIKIPKTSPTAAVAAGLSMMVAVSAFDLMMNSRGSCILPLLGGSLFGLARSVAPTPAGGGVVGPSVQL